jgi:ribosomal protein S18 acetylase RimI-like enzyme
MSGIVIRAAVARDAADIVSLFDMGARGLATHLWGLEAAPGQSMLEVGRAQVLGAAIDYRRAVLADVDGAVAGLLFSYPKTEFVDPDPMPAPLRPIVELENASRGSWFINLLAVYPDLRGRGVGTVLLNEAHRIARSASMPGAALIVDSFNDGAQRLYERSGYRAVERRPVVPFPGHPPGGEFIQMIKSLN